MAAPCLLVGDIGGSNARFALANAKTPAFSCEKTYQCSDFASANQVIEAGDIGFHEHGACISELSQCFIYDSFDLEVQGIEIVFARHSESQTLKRRRFDRCGVAGDHGIEQHQV